MDLFDVLEEHEAWVEGCYEQAYDACRYPHQVRAPKNYKVWEYIKDHKGEEYACDLHADWVMYMRCRRSQMGLSPDQATKYTEGATMFKHVWDLLFAKSDTNHLCPFAQYNCDWCGMHLDWEHVTGETNYCPEKHANTPARRKCYKDSHRSTNSPISLIALCYKIIAQDFKCTGCEVRLPPSVLIHGHIKPRQSEDDDHYENINAICQTCNSTHGSSNMDDWLDDGAPGAWKGMYGVPLADAVSNMLRYIKAYRLKQRCEGIVDGTLKPHKEEAKYAPLLLQWITEQEDAQNGHPVQTAHRG